MTEAKKLLEFLEEAKEEGDPIQASEKLYKVAENCIKLLAKVNESQEYKKSEKEGGWWTKLLDKAAHSLGNIYGEELRDTWSRAYELHQKGFHEETMTLEEVREAIPKIEYLVKLTLRELETEE